MEAYITLAIIAMVVYGINPILYKIAPNIDSISLTFFTTLSLAVFTFIVWLLNTEKAISIKGVGIGILAGLIGTLGFVVFITSIKLGKVSITSTFRALSFCITILLAFLLLGEKITLVKSLGIGLAIIAIILLSL